jgi:hypothetical protein
MTVRSDMLFLESSNPTTISMCWISHHCSLMFIRGHTPEVTFNINGNEHHMGYYLADGIYPSWLVFIKGVPLSQQEKHRFFSAKQSTFRKDVECAFRLMKKRFNILAILDQSYSQQTLGLIMHACIILHNVIIDNERNGSFDQNYHTVTFIVAPSVNYEASTSPTSII